MCLTAALLVGMPIPKGEPSRLEETPAGRLLEISGPGTDAPSETGEGPRRIYRYSVIPGGVQTPEELREALANDPVAAAHHASLAAHRVRTARVDGPRRVYMSYRMRNRVFWTREKVALQPGEHILTDGTTAVRARCGNGISDEPREPVAENEPAAIEFERAFPYPPPLHAIVRVMPPGGPAGALAPPDVPSGLDPETYAPMSGWAVPAVAGPIPLRRVQAITAGQADPPGGVLHRGPRSGGAAPRSIPEPSSLLLLGAGCTAYALRRLGNRRHSAR